ncbi:hypothetical protein Glove_233g9 [Diversispora epigaea]|uniref:Uncharacterized protein n=1 Tax=Diversispora epigaea TaxID=1348612 RepID=A0A397IE10_9GLOM|nr:hypothetical protein Glove_233g9 [Diversispora epigaea]
MIRSGLNLIVSLIAWITLFSLTSSISGLGSFTHNEMNLFDTPPQIWQYGKYIDGTVVTRIINRDPNVTSPSNELWVKQVLSLRIIYPNGTVSEIDIDNKDLEIQGFNWHLTTNPSTGAFQDPISIYALQSGYLIVRYFNASNPDDINTYEEWGRIIDWSGNLYEKEYFSKAYINNDIWYPSLTTIVTNIVPSKGFIRTARSSISHFEWQQYMISDSFNLKKLSNESDNSVSGCNGSYVILNTIATVDEGYGIIIGNCTYSSIPISKMLFLKIGYNETFSTDPFVIYESYITIYNMFCSISSTGIGVWPVCILNEIQNNITSHVKLVFSTSGGFIRATPLSNLHELPSNPTAGWQVERIPYGGYLFYGYFLENNRANTYGYYYDEFENKSQNWEFPEPSVLNIRGTLIILPNNTLLVSQIESNNTWNFLTTDIPEYSNNSDHGYSNFLINSTSPTINANIPISKDTGYITITYYEPVELSDGYIWIYRIDSDVTQNVTRQFVNASNYEFCSISDNRLTVTVKIIRSTFSYPNSKFYVKFDNNFVRVRNPYGEPLIGINDNIWNFNTIPTIEETYPDNFISDLRIKLSKIIPANIERLSLNDLNDMIKYKRITAISLFPITNYLDEDFGSVPKYEDFGSAQNLWQKYKIVILGIVLAFGILIVLFLLAHKKERKGRNMAVLRLGLIIFDFVINSLFVSYNGKVVKKLYIPSLMFLTVPTVVNVIWAFYIIFDENKSKTFLDWFTQHGKVVLIFMVLSGADIETLSILYSNMAGFEFFNAPISTKGKNIIFWASCLDIFIKNIPHVIIQILYLHSSVVIYDIISLFALISSCLSLLTNIVGRLSQTINICRHGSLEAPATERNFTSDELMSHSIHIKDENDSKKNSLRKRSSKGSFQEVIP